MLSVLVGDRLSPASFAAMSAELLLRFKIKRTRETLGCVIS